MAKHRIVKHPVLPIDPRETILFSWQDASLTARAGETIASALFAHGVHILGHHPKDNAPQGIYCANGQCAQCLVLANGRPVKACMTTVQARMQVAPIEGLPILPAVATPSTTTEIEVGEVGALILGGGPAGMSAALELGQQGIATLLVDDKDRLGGKLVLQTHRFFGSADAVYAGMRGIDIAAKLAQRVDLEPDVEVWLNSTALAVFSDRRVGVLRGARYTLVTPDVLVVATGARERFLVFPGNTLPGVYGAGAFQTLVNRDLVRAAERLFIVGGGNVGLIAGYHALQAGIDVVGLVEALPQCSGYRVHAEKLARLGVPIYTSHTVLSANGMDHVTSITIASVDGSFRPLPKTAKTFACDTVLIAVGLDPVNEFTAKARAHDLVVFEAGDAQAIAEASAAMFTGRIAGREAAQALGRATAVPNAWGAMAAVLRSPPGASRERPPFDREIGVFPIFHCVQEIPCDPCTTACPQSLIEIPSGDLRDLPVFRGTSNASGCSGCGRCITVCPGLAITLVDYRQNPELPTVSVPYEFLPGAFDVGDEVFALDAGGKPLGRTAVTRIRKPSRKDRTWIVSLLAPKSLAKAIAGLRAPSSQTEPLPEAIYPLADDAIVCRCERVTAAEVRARIREGVRDVNALKVMTRAGMGACGGKTCARLIYRLFQELGVPDAEITKGTTRPLFVEVPLSRFAGAGNDEH